MSIESIPSASSRQEPGPSRRKRRRKRRRKSRSSIGSFPLAFGKYAGKPISSVPTSYVKWAVATPGVPVADQWVIRRFLGSRKGGCE